jgi:hypothetical protein
LPPPFTIFGTKASRTQKPADKPRKIKPQWKTSQLFLDFGLTPKMVRTPRCHRLKHKRPAEIRQAMQIFPKMWRHKENKKQAWVDLAYKIDGVAGTGTSPSPEKIKAEAKRSFEVWLQERCMADMRVVENVTENHEALEKTLIIPGFRWCDFEHCPELPVTAREDKWDFYATDFATDSYSPLAFYLDNEYKKVNGAVVVPSGIWLRYHGLNMYALSSMIATTHAIPSDTALEGAETACGRGVYTSRIWCKARQYAIPYQLEGSRILTKVIALFVIPGASGEGGTAVWKKKRSRACTSKMPRENGKHAPSSSWCRRMQSQMLVGKVPNVKNRCLTLCCRTGSIPDASQFLAKCHGRPLMTHPTNQMKIRAPWCIWQVSLSHTVPRAARG